MGDETSSSPKLDFSNELKEALKRNLELEVKFESAEARNKSKDTQLSELRKKLGEASTPKPESEPVPALKKEPEEPKEPEKPEHGMSITDEYCPTCGDRNPKWGPEMKNETECMNCGHDLGPVALLGEVKACPGCKLTKMPDGSALAKKKSGSRSLKIGEMLGVKA